MNTFDNITEKVTDALAGDHIRSLEWVVVNRDLFGRVRLIFPSQEEEDASRKAFCEDLYQVIKNNIAPHAYPESSGILYENSREDACAGGSVFQVNDLKNVWFVDRLATESRWEAISDITSGAKRVVYFSIKGGVGRSTAVAASAWYLAKQGKSVLVLDLDLESPGLSSALLPTDKQPKYGIVDWLVEDLVDNGDAVINDLYALSDLSTSGAIRIVPAHGKDPGEYISKLGRVWMPKLRDGGLRESWSSRLRRMINQLEETHKPDVILIDSRAGIDEVSAACVTDLGAEIVFLFSIQGSQTWVGYQALFSHWQKYGGITKIRERLQMVAGLIPDDERKEEYLELLGSAAYNLFEKTYDAVAPGEVGDWSFEEDNPDAPHTPLAIRWNRGWYGLLSLQDRMLKVNEDDVNIVFSPLLKFLDKALVKRE